MDAVEQPIEKRCSQKKKNDFELIFGDIYEDVTICARQRLLEWRQIITLKVKL